MGKFIYSIRFLFIALFTVTLLNAADKSYKILSTDIQTMINNDGTVDFIETREFSFKGDFTFVYQVIPKRGFDKIYDIQVSENGAAYLNKDTKQNGTFLIDERKNSYRIYLYHNSSNETKKFTVKYSLENPFTVGQNDSQFYWIYLSDRWDKKPGDLFISQTFSGEIQNTDIVYNLENPSNSKKYKLNIEDDSLSFISSEFSSNNEMKLRTIFPSSYFINPVVTDSNFSLAAIEKKKRDKDLAQYFIGLLALFSLATFISYARRNLLKFKIEPDENLQFTSFPSNDHPVIVNGLIYRELTLGPTGGGVLSTLFELASLNKLKIEVVEVGKWFKSKRLKITIKNTDSDNVKSSFAKLLLKRMKKFGSETSFRDVFSDFSLVSSDWKSLKKEEVYGKGWVDTSYQDEKHQLAILQFLILNIIIFCAIWFQTFLGFFVSIAPFMFFIIIIASSRLTKEGQLLYNQWGLFMSKLKEGEVDIKKFDPDLMLQYCLALGTQPEELKGIIKNIESEHTDSFVWMGYGGDTSSLSSAASMVSDIASTGTTISASFAGDGGGSGGGGGGAGGGGGGGAG